MVAKLTNEIIDQRLSIKNIKRLDNYINFDTYIKFQCLKQDCNYMWSARPHNLITSNNCGCPKCAGNIKLTNEIIDIRLKNRDIKRLDNYINNHTNINFKCLIENCNHIWSAKPSNITCIGQRGCPKCANHIKLTNLDVDNRLLGRNIRRLNNYVNNLYKINFKCLIENCNYVWSSTPRDIFTGCGCPKCANNIKLTNEIIDEKLMGRNIKRIDDYITTNINISFQCLTENCNYIWETSPSNIINNESGCPLCNTPGKNEKSIYGLLKINNIEFNHNYKIKKICANEINNFNVDFYIPNKNIIIEYNGKQHYQPVNFGGISDDCANDNFIKQQSRDKYVRQFCINNNIKLIEIDGRVYKNLKLEQYIIDDIFPLIKEVA